MYSCYALDRQEEKTPFDEEDHGTSRRTHDASGGSTAAHSPANSKGSGGLLSEDVDVFPFKVDSGINQRMFVYDGDILALRTDCIMCFTVDGFCGSEGLAGRLLSSKLSESGVQDELRMRV